jgi:hypothetical protein
MEPPTGLGNGFVADVQYMLDPSLGGVFYPHLHDVYTDRAPGRDYELSRCPHLGVGAQSDRQIFQQLYQSAYGDIRPSNVMERVLNDDPGFCPIIKQRFILYGTIGRGCEC